MTNKVFEDFNNGRMVLPNNTVEFKDIPWCKHPTFEGVELKHIIKGEETNGEFSYHLVRVAPNKTIGMHIHETQLETHEVIAGKGTCINEGVELVYEPGVISIIPAKVKHEVDAGDEGVYLFAKFMPALC